MNMQCLECVQKKVISLTIPEFFPFCWGKNQHSCFGKVLFDRMFSSIRTIFFTNQQQKMCDKSNSLTNLQFSRNGLTFGIKSKFSKYRILARHHVQHHIFSYQHFFLKISDNYKKNSFTKVADFSQKNDQF